MYILVWGRVVTNMGSMIFPLITLILKNKMGYSTAQAATIMMIIGIIQLPCTMLGGKLADRFNKKNIIVICDMVTVIGYLICAVIPMNHLFLFLLCTASMFAKMEWPIYDALVADLAQQKDRERAYSMNYLGANLGLVLAPTLGGMLFENHLPIAFVISSLATFSSTALIFFCIRDVTPEVSTGEAARYEQSRDNATTAEIFRSAPVLLLFVACIGMLQAVYSVGFSFMIPLSMETFFSGRGALLFGTLTSINALVVIVGTPICTDLLSRMRDTGKLFWGQTLQMLGYMLFMMAASHMVVYYIAMIVFTIGEIVATLGHQPYLTRRVPASHRGRISASSHVFSMVMQSVCLQAAGIMAEGMPMAYVWLLITGVGCVNIFMFWLLRIKDKKAFSLI